MPRLGWGEKSHAAKPQRLFVMVGTIQLFAQDHRIDVLTGNGDDGLIEYIQKAVAALFSWVMLMPIAVIVSGKLLSQRLKISGGEHQSFTIPIPKIFHVQARNDEVILGLAGFFVTLVLAGWLRGASIYTLVQANFGLDPGHFNALLMFSSFVTVLWTALLNILIACLDALRSRTSKKEREYTRQIERVASREEEQNG